MDDEPFDEELPAAVTSAANAVAISAIAAIPVVGPLLSGGRIASGFTGEEIRLASPDRAGSDGAGPATPPIGGPVPSVSSAANSGQRKIHPAT